MHGIRCYRYLARSGSVEKAAQALAAEWGTALGAGYDGVSYEQGGIDAAFYAHLLHLGTAQGAAAEDPELLGATGRQMLADWATALGAPDEVLMGRAGLPVRQIADWIARRHGDLAKRVVVLFCREADTYVRDADSQRRERVRDELSDVLERRRPRVVIAHSLGSVVAYETLWHRPVELDVLITLGSPLGLPGAIRDRLSLGPGNEGRIGQRPPGVRRWVNVADIGDVVAIPRDLPAVFPGIDSHYEVSLGVVASHKATRYLAVPEVAAELASLR
ncbi:serine peptidase [Streptomyces sp. NPDC059828]|uniref:serine peptidase n=1 Tax=Streptomyces sp. NPDC059828 TaxID=3346965 RepID=UPI0036691467